MPDPRRRIRSFLLLAFGISWCIAGIGIALGVSAVRPIAYVAMAGAFMFGPALAAIVQQRFIDRAPWSGLGLGLRAKQWKWIGFTAIVALMILPVCLGVADLLGDVLGWTPAGHVAVTQEQLQVTLEAQMAAAGGSGTGIMGLLDRVQLPGAVWLLLLLGVALLAACTVNLIPMLGEELGWRGYLYQVTSTWMPVRRILFTGVVWGLWHAPLIAMGHNYPGYPVLGIGLMVVFTVVLAFLFDWTRTRCGNVWGPCILHGIINGSAGGFVWFAWAGHPLVASPVGVIGFIALMLLVVLVLVLDRPFRAALTTSPAAGTE
jgi:uncharacterized protein